MKARSSVTTGQLRTLLSESPFHQLFMQMEILDLDCETALLRLKLPFKSGFVGDQRSARYHGGVIAALIDVAGAFVMIAAAGRNVPTIALHVDYLRPAMQPDDLFAEARVRQLGRTVGVADVEITDLKTRLIALGRVATSIVVDQ
jgi:uncharacterized protein (TIGR00369 family)